RQPGRHVLGVPVVPATAHRNPSLVVACSTPWRGVRGRVRLSRAARFIRPPHNALAPANAHPDQPARRGPNTTEKTEAIAPYSAGVTPLAMPTHVLWLPRCPVGWHQRGLGPIGPPGPPLPAPVGRPA